MFWSFFIGLFIASIIFPFVYTFLAIPLFGLMGLFFVVQGEDGSGNKKRFNFLAYPIKILVLLTNVYILSGWSAYAASRAFVYTSVPQVSNKWIYYVVGFFLCYGPLSFMASKEPPEGQSSALYGILIGMAAYILFSIWPSLMAWPYGWFLRWIYG